MWWHKIWSDYWARKCKVYILHALLQSGIIQSTTPTNGISLHRPRLMVPQPKQCRFLLSGFNWGSTLALIMLFHLSCSLVQAGKAQGGRGNSLLYKCFWKWLSCPTTVNIEAVLLHRVYGPINELHEVSWSNGGPHTKHLYQPIHLISFQTCVMKKIPHGWKFHLLYSTPGFKPTKLIHLQIYVKKNAQF